MRKTIMFVIISALAIFALLGTSAAFADFMIKGGVDLGGTLDIEGYDYDVNTGFTAAVEFTKSVAKIVDLGAGGEFQFPRSPEDSSGEFYFIPLYAVGRVKIPIPLHPYATGKIGYNFFLGNEDYKGTDGKLTGGLHYGFGAGIVVFKFLVVEGSYSIYSGVHEWGGSDFDTTYKAFGLKAGVKF
jgi:hypothetical protein